MTKKRNLLIILAVSVSIVIGGFVFMKNFNNDTINAENSSPEGIAQNVIDAENSSPEGTALKVIDEATTVPEVVLPTKSPDYLKSSELILNGISGGMTREQLVEKLGQPKSIEDFYKGLSAMPLFIYEYDNIICDFEQRVEQGEYFINSIMIKGNVSQTPRNIQVGDNFKDVLNKFPQEKDYRTNENGIFYGTMEYHGVNYGYIYYEDKNPAISVSSEKSSEFIKIYFNNGIVREILICFAPK